MSADIRSLRDLASKVSKDPALAESIKQNPAAALSDIAAASVLQTDEWIYRIVVLSLGLAANQPTGPDRFVVQGHSEPA